jgi:hypothetical protein
VVGDHQPQHGVAQELEPLVRLAAVLGAEGAVAQGEGEEAFVGEDVPQTFDECRGLGLGGKRRGQSRPTT